MKQVCSLYFVSSVASQLTLDFFLLNSAAKQSDGGPQYTSHATYILASFR